MTEKKLIDLLILPLAKTMIEKQDGRKLKMDVMSFGMSCNDSVLNKNYP